MHDTCIAMTYILTSKYVYLRQIGKVAGQMVLGINASIKITVIIFMKRRKSGG